jgi:hypothetical protein
VQERLASYAAPVIAANPGRERPIIGYACEISTYDDAAILGPTIRNASVRGHTRMADARDRSARYTLALEVGKLLLGVAEYEPGLLYGHRGHRWPRIRA